tara:strand:- start:217 stop:1029 length:813 start_codon:yes stop_codon:yes gene_type:complete
MSKKIILPQKLTNKVVLITGATSGIGEACAWRFAHENCKLILIGRRLEKLSTLKSNLIKEYPDIKIHYEAMSVTDLSLVEKLPDKLPKLFKDVNILINNAGLALGVEPVYKNNIKDAVTVIDTNVTGLIAFVTTFVPGMISRGEGHIINMGSIAGHTPYQNGSIYNASKFAVNGFTNASRFDLMHTPIRVTHISPGLVGNTEFSNVRLGSDEKANEVYRNIVALTPEDVADNVYYAASRPPHVQISEITMYATNQGGPKDIVKAGISLGK